MPYFNKERINVLFIHIPKTGGTSLECYFSDKCNIPLNSESLYGYLEEKTKLENNIFINSSLQHITYQEIIKYNQFFNINFNNIQLITIVRNPYERIISDLFFLSLMNIESSKEETFAAINNYIFSNELDNHNKPQHFYFETDNDGDTLLQNIKILHTESLNRDMIELGYIDFNVKEQCNKNKVNYYSYLNNDSIHLINTFYEKDFKLFNYKKIIP